MHFVLKTETIDGMVDCRLSMHHDNNPVHTHRDISCHYAVFKSLNHKHEANNNGHIPDGKLIA
ncbi:hypothetical protein AM593_07323, partial [Mytilus galloprovincialis]